MTYTLIPTIFECKSCHDRWVEDADTVKRCPFCGKAHEHKILWQQNSGIPGYKSKQ